MARLEQVIRITRIQQQAIDELAKMVRLATQRIRELEVRRAA